MRAPLPGLPAGHTPDAAPERTTVPGVLARTRPGTGDALRLAAELVDGGFSVALEHVSRDDVAAVLARLTEAGLAEHCEVTLHVERPGDALPLPDDGPSIALAGPGAGTREHARNRSAPRVRVRCVPCSGPG